MLRMLVLVVLATTAGCPSQSYDFNYAGEPDPRAKMRIFARHLRATGERTSAILSVIESAAGTDPEIAQVWRTLQDQRRYGMGAARTLAYLRRS